jgi:phosphatidylserine/phosphatidylglycerophosphate/cardiolipin synthase-like enzyme
MTVRKDDVDRARIVVTVPMRPSRFESALAEINDSGVLIETMDTFLHLSRRAADHLVVVSPFLDADGLEWVSSLFEATRAPERVLICRHYDQVTSPHSRRLSAAGVAIHEYFLEREPKGRGSCAAETFHAKIVLADQVAAYVGSANFLRSSKELSLECGVLLEGQAVKQVHDVVHSMLQVSALRCDPSVQQNSGR